jgi:hypothetical protein
MRQEILLLLTLLVSRCLMPSTHKFYCSLAPILFVFDFLFSFLLMHNASLSDDDVPKKDAATTFLFGS